MSDYERQIEEALARKARESEKGRKSVQSEAGLMSSLRQALSENNADAAPETGSSPAMSLEEMLAEKSRKQASLRRESRLPFAAAIEPAVKETSVKSAEPAVKTPAESAPKTDAGPKAESAPQAETAPQAQAAAKEPATFAEKVEQQTSVKRDPAMVIPSSILDDADAKKDKPVRFHREETGQTGSRKDSLSLVLAALLALFLAAAGVSGGLFYALFTYVPMADAVDNSSCAAVLEGEYLAGLNTLAEEDGLNIVFTREVLVGGQAVRDIKASLKAAYSGTAYQADTERIGAKIESYAKGAGLDSAEQFTAKAGEVYNGIIGAAPDSSWFGQTGPLKMILLVILAAGVLVSVILLVVLAKRGTAGSLARFSFAGAALLMEILSVIVMATGVFRRYSADYSYITVLSTKYMMGGIVACMVIGVFYMVLAVEAAVISAKK